MNGFDEELTRQLRDRSQDVGGHPIGMEQVRRTARRIVWRRRIATGAVAAAVLAVAVPAGFAATGGVNRGVGPVGPSTPSVTQLGPSPTQTPSPSPAPSTTPDQTATSNPSPGLPAGVVPLTTVGIPAGAAPKIPYLDGTTVHNGDVTEQLPGAYTTITPYHGGWVALAVHNGDYSVVQLDPSNNLIGAPQPSAEGIAVDNGGGQTAWFVAGAPGQSGQLVQGIGTGMGEGQASVPVPAGVTAHPVGYVRTGLVYQTDGAHPQVLITDFTPGKAQVWLKGAIFAGGASQAADAISVETKVTDFGSCWAVVDPGWTEGSAAHEHWHTCDYSLGQFSPDGKYIAADGPYRDGQGSSMVAILDARDGTPVATFQRPPDGSLYVTDVAWEDETHLLAVVNENGAWQIIRLDTSGHLETASPAVPGGEFNRPYYFSARP